MKTKSVLKTFTHHLKLCTICPSIKPQIRERYYNQIMYSVTLNFYSTRFRGAFNQTQCRKKKDKEFAHINPQEFSCVYFRMTCQYRGRRKRFGWAFMTECFLLVTNNKCQSNHHTRKKCSSKVRKIFYKLFLYCYKFKKSASRTSEDLLGKFLELSCDIWKKQIFKLAGKIWKCCVSGWNSNVQKCVVFHSKVTFLQHLHISCI